MKPRQLKLNMALPEDKSASLNLARIRRCLREMIPGYNPARAKRQRLKWAANRRRLEKKTAGRTR